MSSFHCDRTKNMADLGISVSDWPIYKENLFLWNYYASWNQTLQEWCLKVLYKIFSFHFDGQKTAVTGNSCFWLTNIYQNILFLRSIQPIWTRLYTTNVYKVLDKNFSFLIGQKTCRHSKFLFLLDQYTKEWFSVVFSSETTVTGVSKLYRNGVSEFRYKNPFPILLHCDRKNIATN
jgi:hypothetical protein